MENSNFKVLQEKIAGITDEKVKIEAQLQFGEETKNYDVELALQIAEEVLIKSKNINNNLAYAKALCIKGFCQRLKGEYNSGIAVLKEALSLSKKMKDKNLEAISHYYMGNIYRDLGDLANVLVNYEKALSINEEIGDEFYQSVILSSISNLLYDLNDYDSALEYALKCLPIFERAKNINNIINIYNTLGNIYFKKEIFADSLYYFKENLERSEPGTASYVMAESGIGKVYYKMQSFDEAKEFLINALRESQEIDNAEIQIICQYYLGRLYMDDNNYRQALINLNHAFTMSDQYLRKHDIMSVHEVLSTLYDKMGDIPKAFHHLKSFQTLKEEIFKQTIINELRNLQVRQQIELAQKEKEVAERTAYLKHQFMANMSHEIRTPMNAIVGMTRLLINKDPKPAQLRYLNAIKQSADNLLVIINDILDLSKIEAGKIVIEEVDFSLLEIIQCLKDMLMLKAEEKHIEFRTYLDGQIPKKLVGDPTRLNQILINLAGNAVKFTDKGYVEINISLKTFDNEIYTIQFDIIDTGIGIEPEFVDTIFDSFTQAGTDVTRKFGGTGLGLTISRQLVNLMDGEISVKSQLGIGTTFTVNLPFKEAVNQDETNSENQLAPEYLTRLNKLKILLVEDNEFNRMVAEDTLKETLPEITLVMANDGLQALEQIKQNRFDLILMDIQMPVMDGMTATKHIRNDFSKPTCTTKIIAMTANVLREDVNQYLDAGMDGYISKPFKSEDLLHTINTVLSTVSLINETNATNKIEQQTNLNLPQTITDMKFLKQFTGGKMDKIHKYINMFLTNAPILISNIKKHYENKDFPSVKIAAHSLKPQLSYMGIKEEYSNILLIEHMANENSNNEKLAILIQNLEIICETAFNELKSLL